MDINQVVFVFAVGVALLFTVSLYYRLKGYMMLEKFKRDQRALEAANSDYDEDEDDIPEDYYTRNLTVTMYGWIRVVIDLSLEVMSLGIVMYVFSFFTKPGSYYTLAILFMGMTSYYGFKSYFDCKRKSRVIENDATV